MKTILLSFSTFFLVLLCARGDTSAPVAISLEGEAMNDEVTAIFRDHTAMIGEKKVSLDLLRRIDFPAVRPSRTTASKGNMLLILANGSSIWCDTLLLNQEVITFESGLLGRQEISIDFVTGLRFRNGFSEKRFEEGVTVALEQRESDNLFLIQPEGEVLEVNGLVEEIDRSRLLFLRDGGDDLESAELVDVHGIVLATPLRTKNEIPVLRLLLTDGSRINVEEVEMKGDGSLKASFLGQSVSVPTSDVDSIAIRSPNLEFLSDLDPLFSSIQPLLAIERKWQRDAAVTGGPLLLDGEVFEKGIGICSRSELLFDCSDFDRFVATVGIDDSASGRGDCIFVVRVDGAEVARTQANSDSGKQSMKIDLNGGTRLSLAVEPGPDLDLSDFANWGDASLIRNR